MDDQSTKATKFCKHCGKIIDEKAVFCIHCGCQVEEIKVEQQAQPIVNITNSNNNTNTNSNINGTIPFCKLKNKWVAFFLCFFLGWLGAHKFYEGKIGMGILYICTFGLFCIGWLFDLIALLAKPNPYYV